MNWSVRRTDYKPFEIFTFLTYKLVNKVTCIPKITDSITAIESYLDSNNKLKKTIYRDGEVLTIDMSELLTSSAYIKR